MFGNAQAQFIARSIPRQDDAEPTVTAAAIEAVVALVRDAKKGEAYLKKALDVQQAVEAGQRALAEIHAQMNKAEADRDRFFADIEAKKAKHDRDCAIALTQIENDRKSVAALKAQAESDAKKAADLKAEMARRIAQMERASQGAA